MAKNKLNIVYSTNPNFSFDSNDEDELETLPPNEQTLSILIDRKQRKGKVVTVIANFIGTEEDMKSLSKLLKNKCGVGGSTKDGEIIIQGEMREKVIEILSKEGYNTKRVGG